MKVLPAFLHFCEELSFLKNRNLRKKTEERDYEAYFIFSAIPHYSVEIFSINFYSILSIRLLFISGIPFLPDLDYRRNERCSAYCRAAKKQRKEVV